MVIQRAMIACENSGHSITCDFPEVSKIVDAGATTKPVLDYEYQLLAETAHDAGVITNEEFAIFQNAGYMGLYGG